MIDWHGADAREMRFGPVGPAARWQRREPGTVTPVARVVPGSLGRPGLPGVLALFAIAAFS